MPDEVVERRRVYGNSPLSTIVSLYLLVGLLIGVYRVFIMKGVIVLTLSSFLLDLITILLYMLLWPFFLFGGLQFRIS